MTNRFLLLIICFALGSNTVFGQVNFVEHLIGTQADGAHFVGIADMDNDGDIDIVSSSEFDSDLRVYLNNGNQVFTDNILTWVTASNLIITDFDEDGDQDIFTTCGADGSISWFRNLGGGSFNTAASYNEATPRPAYLILSDIDQDNDLDIVSTRDANSTNGNLSWLENTGFNAFLAQETIAAGTNVERVAAVDLNNDGFPELVTVADGAVKWYANNAGNIASNGTTIDNTVLARTIDVADINGDGFTDIVVGSLDFAKPLAWYPNNGGTAFGTVRLISNQFGFIHQAKVADMDNDGDIDVVASDDINGNKIVWFANNGSGTFGVLRTIKNGISSPHGIALADIDDDGDIDVAATSSASDQVLWYENQIPTSIQEVNAEAMGLQAVWIPQSQQMAVSFSALPSNHQATLSLYSIDGKEVARQAISLEVGQNHVSLAVADLPHGIYCLQLKTAEQAATIKVVR